MNLTILDPKSPDTWTFFHQHKDKFDYKDPETWKFLGAVHGFVPVWTIHPNGEKVIDRKHVPKFLRDKLPRRKKRIQSSSDFAQRGTVNIYEGAQPAYRKVIQSSPEPNFRLASFVAQEGICYYCHSKTDFKFWTTEHRIPLSRGGSNKVDNKIGACRYCNNNKGCLTENEFFWEMRYSPRSVKRAVAKVHADLRKGRLTKHRSAATISFQSVVSHQSSSQPSIGLSPVCNQKAPGI